MRRSWTCVQCFLHHGVSRDPVLAATGDPGWDWCAGVDWIASLLLPLHEEDGTDQRPHLLVVELAIYGANAEDIPIGLLHSLYLGHVLCQPLPLCEKI